MALVKKWRFDEHIEEIPIEHPDGSVSTEKIADGAISQLKQTGPLPADYSTTSTTYIDLPGGSLSITTGESVLYVDCWGIAQNLTLNNLLYTAIFIDDVYKAKNTLGYYPHDTGALAVIKVSLEQSVPAGTHSVRAKIRVNTGEARWLIDFNLVAVEFKR